MRRCLLTLAVHLDAARLFPREWSMALWWRIMGKRVRSRARFAPLLGASALAYRVWLLDEPEALVENQQSVGTDVQIVAFVAAGKNREKTVRSALEQGISVLSATEASHALTPDPVADDAPVWLMLLEAGDTLAPGAGAAYRSCAACSITNLIYADDDLIDERGHRLAPHFKPSWNDELFRHHDYLSGACIVRVAAGDLDAVRQENGVGRILERAVSSGATPVHLPQVLHHRRQRPAPCIIPPASGDGPAPKVSVIIPTRNRLDLLRTCVEGLEATDYPAMEIIIVDNGSDDPATLHYLAGLDPGRFQVLRDDGPFNFSRLNNRAATLASGELLCLLNNDIEMLTSDWLTIMVHQALREEVGAVGAQLLYPDGRIQHAGVVLGICGGAAHAHRLLSPEAEGYFRRHALPQFVSAVTAACLVVRRSRFEAVGGLDEEHLAVAFNDVDLCMRLNARGWQSLYEPRARLVHHESVSRGLDRDPVGAARLAGELEVMKTRWGTGDMDRQADPFHHPQLSRYSECFALRLSL